MKRLAAAIALAIYRWQLRRFMRRMGLPPLAEGTFQCPRCSVDWPHFHAEDVSLGDGK